MGKAVPTVKMMPSKNASLTPTTSKSKRLANHRQTPNILGESFVDISIDIIINEA